MESEETVASAPLVYLVVLNWNGYVDTQECLESLRRLDYPYYQIVVVDNGSTDDSPSQIADNYPKVELVRCADNRGIAAGYNQGIRVALERGATHVVVMNNDLVFAPDFLSQMVSVTEQWPSCGVVMPKIFYYDEPEVIWSTGGRTRWFSSNILLRGRGEKDGPRWQQTTSIDLAPSCCLLLTRAVCEQVAFDDHYFFYFDDWDFCLQVRGGGWQIVYAADAHLWHKVSQSTQNSPKSLRWWRILGQSCVRFHRKHYSLLLLSIHVTWVLLREIIKGNVRSLPTFLQGVKMGLQAKTLDDVQPRWSV
jgi:GT2 family glycosyltransferase